MIAFALGAYDRNKPLVIDPQILYATYLGGSSTSTVANEGAPRRGSGRARFGLHCRDHDIDQLPNQESSTERIERVYNAFITKLDANGQLVYSTYLGGSGFDEGRSSKSMTRERPTLAEPPAQ